MRLYEGDKRKRPDTMQRSHGKKRAIEVSFVWLFSLNFCTMVNGQTMTNAFLSSCQCETWIIFFPFIAVNNVLPPQICHNLRTQRHWSVRQTLRVAVPLIANGSDLVHRISITLNVRHHNHTVSVGQQLLLLQYLLSTKAPAHLPH